MEFCALVGVIRDIALNLFEKYWVKDNTLEGFIKMFINVREWFKAITKSKIIQLNFSN